MSWPVRSAGPGDIAGLCALQAKAGDTAWSANAYEQELYNPRAWIAVVDAPEHGIVGLLVAWEVAGEVQLQNLAVDPAYRRRGIAKVLLDALVLWAREKGAATIELEVRSGNVPAQRLYELAGFEEVGRRPKYYRASGEDALLMRLAVC